MTNATTKILEVCVECLDGVRIALDAGADRIEFSERLEVGGVTPAFPLLAKAVHLCRETDSVDRKGIVPIIALIRCRPGDFCFDAKELQLMLAEIEQAIDSGCDGVAVGAALPGQDLNWKFLESVAERYATKSRFELVVHRVFDSVPKPMIAIPRLIDLGYRRILTSGGADHAINSLEQLQEWQQAFGDQIEFLPAGGVSSVNASSILQASGCTQLHGSFRRPSQLNGKRVPDPEEIRLVKQALT